MIWSYEKIKRYAKTFRENGQAFFYYKENADRFAQAMRARGYQVGRIRSSGPNIEKINKKGARSYGVLIGKKKTIRKTQPKKSTRKVKQSSQNYFSGGFGISTPKKTNSLFGNL